MNNNTSSLLVIGMAAIMVLCATTVAIVAVCSDNGDGMSADEKDFYAGYKDGYALGLEENISRTMTVDATGAINGLGKDAIIEDDSDTMDFRSHVKALAKVAIEDEAATEEDIIIVRSEAYKFGHMLGYQDAMKDAYGEQKQFSLYLDMLDVRTEKMTAEVKWITEADINAAVEMGPMDESIYLTKAETAAE